MRIEGTYTFPAPVEQVYAALSNPDVLGAVLPGCERLIQLGPADHGQLPTYETRWRPGSGPGVYTASVRVSGAERPACLRFVLRGRGPRGPVTGHGVIDLTRQGERTAGAYHWEVEARGLTPDEERALSNGAGHSFIREACERLARAASGELVQPGLPAHTMRGRIAVVRSLEGHRLTLAPAVRRATWMGAGVALGLGILVVLFTVVRRRDERDGRDGRDGHSG